MTERFLSDTIRLVMVLIGLYEFGWENLPFHLCGINILLIAFDTIKQSKVVRSFLYNFIYIRFFIFFFFFITCI